MSRGDLRRNWRIYWAARHALFPYMEPLDRPSWLERTWIRLFG